MAEDGELVPCLTLDARWPAVLSAEKRPKSTSVGLDALHRATLVECSSRSSRLAKAIWAEVRYALAKAPIDVAIFFGFTLQICYY